jgi:hypothetical protein
MAQISLTLGVRRKWWVIPSMRALSLLCRVTGYAPDLSKVAEWYAANGFQLTVDGKRTGLGAR